MLYDEGLPQVWARHGRYAAATRVAVRAWWTGCGVPRRARVFQIVTAVLLPDGYNADRVRDIILDRFDMSLVSVTELTGQQCLSIQRWPRAVDGRVTSMPASEGSRSVSIAVNSVRTPKTRYVHE
jgi:hypothetical protein